MDEKRNFSHITACGEDCTGCAKRAQGLCGGCREQDGCCQEWAQTGRCPVHACASDHGVPFCGLCAMFPCEKLPSLMPWKTDVIEQFEALVKAYRHRSDRP